MASALLVALPLSAVALQEMSPEERMAVLVNQARIAQGLNPVAMNAELSAAALAHTRDMVAKGYMEHEAPDGSTPQQRAVRAGYDVPARSAWIVVEVISARATAEAAANWLLSDRLHRGVMLRPTWREMGIAYVKGGPHGQFWTIEFGCRPNILPVMAEPAPNGGMTVRLTNEECAPAGGNDKQIGRATEMVVSGRNDFEGAAWESFAVTKSLPQTGNVFVKLRDGRGREATASANAGAVTLAASSIGPGAPLPASPAPAAAPPAAPAQPAESPAAAPLLDARPPSLFDPPAAPTR